MTNPVLLKGVGYPVDKGIVDLPDRLPEGTTLEGHFDPGSSGLPERIPGRGPVLPSLPPGLGGADTAAGSPAQSPGGALGRRISREAAR